MPLRYEIVEEGDLFLKPPPFQQCHASSCIPLSNGMLCAFFAGDKEGSVNTAIWGSYFQDGKWSDPTKLIKYNELPHWNPVLHKEGNEYWLYFKIGETVQTWGTYLAKSTDGVRFSEVIKIGDSNDLPRGPARNKLIKTSTGALLAPGSIEQHHYWDSFIDRSTDSGVTWKMHRINFRHEENHFKPEKLWEGLMQNQLWETNIEKVFKWDGIIQPTLWESRTQHIHALFRSTRGTIFRSDSQDDGITWSTAYPIKMPNNNSGIDVVKVNDDLLLLCNPVGKNWGNRTPITLFHSHDNGVTWEKVIDLQTGQGEFSYPCIVQWDSSLFITFTANRVNIKYFALSKL